MPVQDKLPSSLRKHIGYLVTDVGRLYRIALDQKMDRFGLARSEWWLLAFLLYFEGSTQQELVDVMDLGKSAVAKLLDKLEGKGLVKRIADQNDGRSKRVFLTDAVKPVATQIEKELMDVAVESMEALSPAEGAQLIQLLTRLRQQLLQQHAG